MLIHTFMTALLPQRTALTHAIYLFLYIICKQSLRHHMATFSVHTDHTSHLSRHHTCHMHVCNIVVTIILQQSLSTPLLLRVLHSFRACLQHQCHNHTAVTAHTSPQGAAFACALHTVSPFFHLYLNQTTIQRAFLNSGAVIVLTSFLRALHFATCINARSMSQSNIRSLSTPLSSGRCICHTCINARPMSQANISLCPHISPQGAAFATFPDEDEEGPLAESWDDYGVVVDHEVFRQVRNVALHIVFKEHMQHVCLCVNNNQLS